MNNFLKTKSIVSQDSFFSQKTRVSDYSSKQNRIDFITLSTGPGLRKKKKNQSIILKMKMKSEEHICIKSLYRQPLNHKFL